MNDEPDGPQITPDCIKVLRAELFKRAAGAAPAWADAVIFGQDLADDALAYAYALLLEGVSQTEEDLRRLSHWKLGLLLLDEYRKTDRQMLTQSIQALEEAGTADSLHQLTANEPLPDCSNLSSLVAPALAKMNNPEQREVLELRFWHGMQNKEIAAKLGVSMRTVIRRYLAAEKAFRIAFTALANEANS